MTDQTAYITVTWSNQAGPDVIVPLIDAVTALGATDIVRTNQVNQADDTGGQYTFTLPGDVAAAHWARLLDEHPAAWRSSHTTFTPPVPAPVVRSVTPVGVSPDEEWHGPYEVVTHPGTGRFYVIDNTGRKASVLPLRGFPDADAAGKSRDYIDTRRAAREHGRALADAIFTGAMDILDPTGTPASRRSEDAVRAAQRLLDIYGDPAVITWDDDTQPYVRVDAGDSSGWFVLDYGHTHLVVRHVADPNQDQDQIELPGTPSSFTTPGARTPGWTRQHTVDELTGWVADVGGDYARNIPAIVRWTQQR